MTGTIEILLYAAIAAFLVARLRGVLGEKSEGESQHTHSKSTETQSNIEPQQLENTHDNKTTTVPHLSSSLRQTLQQMNAIDDSVTYEGFMQGAATAFPMITQAFASKDTETLEHLLSDKLFKAFDKDIQGRNERGETLKVDIKRIISAEITDAFTKGGRAYITVKFITQENRMTKNSAGKVIAGSKGHDETVVNVWTFARKLGSESNVWTLETTKAR